MKMLTLRHFLVDWREAQAQYAQGGCLMAEGYALQREATARMLLLLGEVMEAHPDLPGRSLEALLSPEYGCDGWHGGAN